jgi:hypothetical protein
MSMPLIEVRINDYALSGREWRINYTVTSKSTTPVFLVQDQRLPFLRMSADNTTIAVWLGIPPQSEAELNRLVNALILPGPLELAPGEITRRTTFVKWPVKQSGYWLEEGEEIAIPLTGKADVNVLIIQGFGLNALDPQRVRSIDQLFAWQLTAQSQVVTFTLPPATP